jgi:HSP20 family protein
MIKKIKPVSRIIKIEEEINRIMGEVFFQKKEQLILNEGWVPCVDIYEKENEIIVETELPGVRQKDITILLHSSRIEVKGLKKEEVIAKKIKYSRLEREFGNFRRTIFLPSSILPEKTKASLENGILIITLKKYKKKEKEVLVKIEKAEE